MPDEFSTPFPDLPETLTQADIAGQQHAASWAKTFEPSTEQYPRTGTSLALRRQHRGDIEQYAATVEEQRMLAHQQRLMQDKNALQYELRSRAMDMKERQDKFNMGMAVKKLDNAEEAQTSLLAARAAQAEAAKTRQILQDTAVKKAADIEIDANKFMTELHGISDEEGTPAHDAAVLSLRAKYPRARLDDRIKPMVTAAEANRLRREKASEVTGIRNEATAKAEALGMVPKTVTSTGGVTYGPKKTLNEEQKRLASEVRRTQGEFMDAASTYRSQKAKEEKMTQEEKDLFYKSIPEVEALRKTRDAALADAKGGGLNDEDLAEPPKTEIIERNGKKYQVDHVNKKVLRVVE